MIKFVISGIVILSLNIPDILVTFEVSQELIFISNSVALSNICDMLVTLVTFQELIS